MKNEDDSDLRGRDELGRRQAPAPRFVKQQVPFQGRPCAVASSAHPCAAAPMPTEALWLGPRHGPSAALAPAPSPCIAVQAVPSLAPSLSEGQPEDALSDPGGDVQASSTFVLYLAARRLPLRHPPWALGPPFQPGGPSSYEQDSSTNERWPNFKSMMGKDELEVWYEKFTDYIVT